jgi:hypothetical protein
MRKVFACLSMVLAMVCMAEVARAQAGSGALQFTAHITPTAARPEPVRQFTFYLLTRSYSDIAKGVSDRNTLPPRDKFIEQLNVSPEMKGWLKIHGVMDLTLPGLDQLLSSDDIIHVPEFLLAYERSNAGGVTRGLPHPKYRETDRAGHPERFEARRQEYLAALKKFIEAHPQTVNGIELQLEALNPQLKWARLQADHDKRIQQQAPELAQSQYLAAQAETDLQGNASISGVPEGTYWISTLNLQVAAGDTRLRWDVPVTIHAGQTTRIELSNLNASENSPTL